MMLVGTMTDHELNTELLNAELPDSRFADAAYLHWLYDENPLGAGIYANGDEDGRRMAHYAVIPQRYRGSDTTSAMVFSLNAVTRSGGQRRGWFTSLGEDIYGRAAAVGARGVIGVSNDNSTPPVVKNLDFRLLGPLPVRAVPVGLRRPVAGVQHLDVDAAFLSGGQLADLALSLDDTRPSGWVNELSTEYLRWRLGAPNMGSPYWVHVSGDLLAVSARDMVGGLRFAVILKLAPRRGAPTAVDPGPMIASICRHHRAPLAMYAGFNHRVPVRGIRPPRRIQPSPLNLIFRSLDPTLPKESFRLDTFEFLDMDAY
jgi:hypothetical protein